MNRFNQSKTVSLLLVGLSLILVKLDGWAEARDKGGDDIILTKGKIIMRGGKGKGNIILDPGSQSHHVQPMMPPMMSLMGHFNPFSFYPMHHHQQHHQPPMVIHPVYIEDHSAMHQHHQPEQHHEYHHQEEPHNEHHQHHEMGHHYEPHHYEMPHHEEHHEEPHHEHHHEPHHEPMMGHHYEHEGGHHEDEGGYANYHGGYESHPIMSTMMHGASNGAQPAANYQQMATMQAMQQPAIYAQPHTQLALGPQMDHQTQFTAYQQQNAALASNVGQQQVASNQEQKESANQAGSQPQQAANSKPTSLLEKSANNPLIQIIKPLFKRNKDTSNNSQKKP